MLNVKICCVPGIICSVPVKRQLSYGESIKILPEHFTVTVLMASISILLNWFLTVVSFATSGLSLFMPGVVTITNENRRIIVNITGIFAFF